MIDGQIENHIYIYIYIYIYISSIIYFRVSDVAQSCPTLCDSMDCNLLGSSIHGIFPGKINWSGLPFPSPEDLPNLGIEPGSSTLQADALPSELPRKLSSIYLYVNFLETSGILDWDFLGLLLFLNHQIHWFVSSRCSTNTNCKLLRKQIEGLFQIINPVL